MKALGWIPVAAGVALLAYRFAPKLEKACERALDKMPDHFPPKWMYLNITAIRKQNERILQLLEEQAEAQG